MIVHYHSLMHYIHATDSFIMENYAQGSSPFEWSVLAQFQVSLLDLRYYVQTKKNFRLLPQDVDGRDLKSQEYQRALTTDGLADDKWSVDFSAECEPGSACEAIVEFFEVCKFQVLGKPMHRCSYFYLHVLFILGI